jgi:cell division septation protein DedD
MSEIDDIFARLGGGRITATDQRDQRDIPRRGKAGGSRVVEVVHVTSRRSGATATLPRRSESGMRAQSWDGGFPTRPTPHPAPSPQPGTAKAPAPVGHVITRWEPVAAPAPITEPTPALAPTLAPTLAPPLAPPAESRTRPEARPVADPFNPDDDRANCLRCGYAVEAARERRGLMTCAACAGTGG